MQFLSSRLRPNHLRAAPISTTNNARLFLGQQRRCTDVFVVTEDNSRVHARTMEFGEIGQLLTMTPRGNKRDMLSPFQGVPGVQSDNPYGYYSMNVAVDLASGGIWKNGCDGANEKGLSVGALYMPGYAGFTEVPSKDEADKSISNLLLTDFLLGNFESVDEIRSEIPKYYVWDMITSEEYGPALTAKFGPGVPSAAYHWVVYDASGKGIVIEYINGQLAIHDSIGVFTNSPNYDWHVTNVTHYDAMTPTCPPGFNFGQGYGMLGAPGDWSPPGRFVRAYLQRKFMKKSVTSDDAVNALSHVMNTVDMVNGVAVGGLAADITNWLVIKDLAKDKMYYRVYDGLNWCCIDMDFAKLAAMEGKPAWDVVLPSGNEIPMVDVFGVPQKKKN